MESFSNPNLHGKLELEVCLPSKPLLNPPLHSKLLFYPSLARKAPLRDNVLFYFSYKICKCISMLIDPEYKAQKDILLYLAHNTKPKKISYTILYKYLQDLEEGRLRDLKFFY